MSLPKGTRANVEWVVVSDKANILHWDGLRVNVDTPIRGTKMGVWAWITNFAIAEGLMTKDHVIEFARKAVQKNVIASTELESAMKSLS